MGCLANKVAVCAWLRRQWRAQVGMWEPQRSSSGGGKSDFISLVKFCKYNEINMKQFHAKLISRCMGVVVFLAVGAHDPRYSGGGSTATAAGGRSRGDREHPRPITQNHPHAPLLLDYVC